MVSQTIKRRGIRAFRSWSNGKGFWQAFCIDIPLFFALALLAGFGLMVLFSATGQNEAETQRQGMAVIVAFMLMLFIAQFDSRFFKSKALWLYLAGLALLVVVLFIGVEVNGAKSWLNLPGLPQFQPAELSKFLVPMLMARYFANRPLPPTFRDLFVCAVIILVPTALIEIQNDTGTALMVLMSGLFVLLLAGLNWRLIFFAIGAVLVASPAWWMFLAKPHQRNRIMTFIDPYRDPTGTGYNIIQSQIAIGSGGVQGKGWLNGAQSRLDFIPESNTDFIFAVLAEEFGLLGVLFLIALYLFVLIRGFQIALAAQDTFGRLLAGSIILTFFFYMFVNMAMVSGLMPVVGLPLPLVSKGGTSVMTLLIGFGLLMSIHTHRRVLPR